MDFWTNGPAAAERRHLRDQLAKLQIQRLWVNFHLEQEPTVTQGIREPGPFRAETQKKGAPSFNGALKSRESNLSPFRPLHDSTQGSHNQRAAGLIAVRLKLKY